MVCTIAVPHARGKVRERCGDAFGQVRRTPTRVGGSLCDLGFTVRGSCLSTCCPQSIVGVVFLTGVNAVAPAHASPARARGLFAVGLALKTAAAPPHAWVVLHRAVPDWMYIIRSQAAALPRA